MKRLLKNLAWRAVKFFFSAFYRLQNEQVYFRAYGGLQYSCNPRSISEKIHEMSPEVKIVWCFINPDSVDVPDYVKKVKKNTFKDFKALFTSRFWIMNAGLVIPAKRKKQIFIDTWHGDRAFKNVRLDPHGRLSGMAYRVVDYVLSGSDYGDRVFREELDFQGKILHTGLPRNDALFINREKRTKEAKRKLGLEGFDKILMYAPTFREDLKMPDLRFSDLLDSLEKKDSLKWCLLVRLHHKAVYVQAWNDDLRIFNESRYPEMQDLLLVSDIVVSDYSSLVGDYVLLKRPVVLYVPDMEKYKNGRGLNFELEKSPFVYAENQENLFEKILGFSSDSARENCEKILGFYGHVVDDGKASERVASFILKKMRE